jgi:hypothetical protein
LSAQAATLAALLLGLSLAASARAEDVKPDKACTAKTAQDVAVNEIASHPAQYAGKCVRVKGWWRDIGIYASRGEAFQPDALSIITLDERRIGLYLSPKDLKAAPKSGTMAEAIGTAGACATLRGADPAALTGYCHYKAGAYLAVARIAPAK